jgi:hypothetical protein
MTAGQDFTQGRSTDDGEGDSPRARRRPVWLLVVGVLAVGLLLGGASAAVLSGGGSDGGGRNSAGAGVSSTTATTATPRPRAGAGEPGPHPPGDPGKPGKPAPTIVAFDASVQSIGCIKPGAHLPITLSWSTEDATGVALTMDGVDLGTFDPSSSQPVKVLCDGAPHVYALTAVGDGGESTKQLHVVTSVPKAVITDFIATPGSLICQPGDVLVDVHFQWATKNAKTIELEGTGLLSSIGIAISSVRCDGTDQHVTLTAHGWGPNNTVSKTITVHETLFKT